MGKRRRERDKPKAGPEAPYNPNKRVLLSYGDSDDEAGEVTGAYEPRTDVHLTNYSLDEYISDEEDVTIHADAGEHEDTPEQGAKREIRRDQFTNQFPALGSALEEEEEEEEEDAETKEAMAYLKAVRTERQRIPEILTATAAEIHHEDYGKEEWDSEEAFIGAPSTGAPAEDSTDPQVAFTKKLVRNFLDQRRLLHLPASLDALKALDDDQPISFPRGNNKAYAEWHRIVSSKASQPAQIRSLQPDTVLDLLALIQKHFLVKGKNVKKITSSWIWSLLARLDEVGNMTNDRVYPLRELGKRAVYVQYSMTNPVIAAQLEAIGEAGVAITHVDENEIDIEDGLESEVKQNAPRTIGLKEDFATDNTKATLDMILVIVGEVFGQRDLLEFRRPWTESVDGNAT